MESNNYNQHYQPQPKSGNGLIIFAVVLCSLVFVALIFGILFLTGVINLPNSPSVEQTMYVVDNAYLRSEPSDTSTILISLSPGAAVTYHKDANSVYASVTYANVDGVFDGYLEKSILSATKPTIPYTTTMYVANVKHSIYFRSAPVENSGNIICEIPLGTPITFIENTDNVFSKISYNGQEGYVKREYLSLSVPNPYSSAQLSGNTAVSSYRYVANVKTSIYLRSAPVENNSNIICEIPVGTPVGFIEYADNVFSKISYNGNIGYAKTQYLSTHSASNRSPKAVDTMTVCNVKTSIYLRRAPVEDSSNIICEIPVGSTVTFLENANGTFYKINWNGYTGYAKSEYLR